jgi:hypothetical protein
MNIGQIDSTRLSRAYQYLLSRDTKNHPDAFNHSISLNGYIQMNLLRVDSHNYTLNIYRLEDKCFLYVHTFDMSLSSDYIVNLLYKELLKVGTLPKCLICNTVSMENGYCELCYVMSTTIDDTCAICLEETRKEAVWVKTSCNHSYHFECYRKLQQASCPLCREVMKSSPKII